MLRYATVVAFCCLFYQVQATEGSPRIIIIGSGPAGVAAGSRLLENGFENITILEAENRIGGRLYTMEFNGYPVDLGGQWVTGEENNAVFELVWPLGLIERSNDQKILKIFSSSGSKMPEDTANGLMNFFFQLGEMELPEEYNNRSIGDWYKPKLVEYFENHPDIMTIQREPLLRMLCLQEMSLHAGDDWFGVSAKEDYIESEGDQMINWKNRTYGFIIDILLKKFPNPAEELSFRNKSVLNAEVTRISYNNSDGTVRVAAENGQEYTADHVIVTASLGVLKSDHEKLFDPPLPEAKVNAIKGLEFGSVAKIYLFYPEPWWPETDAMFGFEFFWTDEDRNELANDPNKSWLLGIYSIVGVEHKSGLLCCWLSGVHAREMENAPLDSVMSGTKEILHRFLGKTYNLTEPTGILRTQWYINKHFRGTYSYRSPETVRSGATAAHLAEPIIEHEYPRILFAGEATSSHQFATVNGAISSGWREADRLIKLYDVHRNTTGKTRR